MTTGRLTPEPHTEVRQDQVTTHWLPITYRDYYDVPRMLVVRFEGQAYLFDCPFDVALDEYPDR